MLRFWSLVLLGIVIIKDGAYSTTAYLIFNGQWNKKSGHKTFP